jgi:hypothetical protein
MVSYKDKIITFPLFNTCYPRNPARNLASFFDKIMFDLLLRDFWLEKGTRFLKSGGNFSLISYSSFCNDSIFTIFEMSNNYTIRIEKLQGK